MRGSLRHLRRDFVHYLWLEMRSAERFVARERRELRMRQQSTIWTDITVASCGRLVVSLIRSATSARQQLEESTGRRL